MKYIAYGSNMVQEQMAVRCPEAKLIGTGYISGARLEFYLHATVEATGDKRNRVPVAVWEINDRDERNLDRYEGYPSYYIKEEWPVHMNDGSEITGMIYLMNMIRKSPPHTQYYEGIADAYRKLGFKLTGNLPPVTYRIDPKTCRRINPRQWEILKKSIPDKEIQSYRIIQNRGSRKWVLLLSDEGKAAIVQLHVDGIKAYVDNSSEDEGEILTDS